MAEDSPKIADRPEVGRAGDAELRRAICDALQGYVDRTDTIAVSAHLAIVCLEYAAAAHRAGGGTLAAFMEAAVEAFGLAETDYGRFRGNLHLSTQERPS